MKKIIVCALSAIFLLSLVTPTTILAKPDMDKPLPATNVHLGNKVTLYGEPPTSRGKPVSGAATGAFGNICTGNKYAIVIGISDYPGTAKDLSYCDEDAEDMVKALTELYGYDITNIITLIDENGSTPHEVLEASFDNIRNAINTIKAEVTSDNDEVVFFFSGHGATGTITEDNTQDAAQGVDSNGVDEAIVCHDGNQNGELQLIWDGQLREWFAGFNTNRIIFIFDSCFAGGMTDLAASDRIINMACGETKLSSEWSRWGGGHGQFTYYFVDEGMIQGWADIYDHDKDGTVVKKKNPGEGSDVVVEEAFDYAYKKCTGQTPIISDGFNKDLLP